VQQLYPEEEESKDQIGYEDSEEKKKIKKDKILVMGKAHKHVKKEKKSSPKKN
jgi:hypothetical protein